MTVEQWTPGGTGPDQPTWLAGKLGELLSRTDAELLGTRIQAHAARIAEAVCELLILVGEFDARDGLRHFVGLKSTAHWLAWACSMDPHTAREHVRVARALRSMPRTVELFRTGRLSYSKVREMTRVAAHVDEERLIDLARAMTASQLSRTVATVRAVAGSLMGQEAIREASWRTREDGMVEIRAVLPPDTGAEVTAALELALARDLDPAIATGETTGAASITGADGGADGGEVDAWVQAPPLEHSKADALVEIARAYLDTAPADRSGEDRHLVVVEVGIDALAAAHTETQPQPRRQRGADAVVGFAQDGPTGPPTPAGNVPAGTPTAPGSVPAGTLPQRCGVVDGGRLEALTAERLACTGKVALIVTSAAGEVLHLGRTRRLASPAQRRALRLQQRTCQFPGCHQTRHLDAHHITPWSRGGATDLDGLALLCRRHHVLVHEGGLHLEHPAPGTYPALRVLDAAGAPVQARWPSMLETAHITPLDETGEPILDGSPAPDRIFPATGGYGFHLDDCVTALLDGWRDAA
ncbi:HNH endonuclease signature motif containing protein [Brachybacterium huguangmaarense]